MGIQHFNSSSVEGHLDFFFSFWLLGVKQLYIFTYILLCKSKFLFPNSSLLLMKSFPWCAYIYTHNVFFLNSYIEGNLFFFFLSFWILQVKCCEH